MLDQHLKRAKCQVEIVQQLLFVILKNARHFEDELLLDMIHLVFLALDQWAIVEEKVCERKEAFATEEWHRNKNAVGKAACNFISSTHKLRLRNFEKNKLPKHLKVTTCLFRNLASCQQFNNFMLSASVIL